MFSFGFEVTRVSKSANLYPARIIRLSAIQLALTTYPTGSMGAAATMVALLVSGIRIDLLAPSLVVCGDAAKAKGRILRSVLSRHYTGHQRQNLFHDDKDREFLS